ncbi:hypothetical protein [Paenibacillus glucanolyticus]|uniref:hypothetical protein n=1 Tax=Paenibacillus glucanolyticus TaxID=59843 RepID=UPI00096D64D0|nr:hypothetical protein [Paenibacillus glucanolyticus]OMF66243.1 hypothetical protein BK142_29550 [Paenibacillus glucanolyticus]
MKEEFAALGQFITSDELDKPGSVEATVNTMEKEFGPAGDSFPKNLKYDPNSGWIAGLKFQPLRYINLAALFQDLHNRYGLFVGLDDDGMAGPFKGLQAEVQYEKREGAPGRFSGAIQLPDAQRSTNMGAVKMVIPEVSFDLYRNGDFKIDIGFPIGLDFSRSLCIEAPPYIGWGGLYFSRKSNETSAYANVPEVQEDVGSFESIIEAGIAVKLGYGKSFGQGILEAGLSITGIGILEGTIATFRSAKDSSKHDKFNWYKGVLGLAGNIFGRVNLEVLTAEIDCQVSTTADLIMEAYRSSNIAFDFNVDASGEIEVNFGFTKGKITKEFHEHFKMDFTMGEDRPEDAPWYSPALMLDASEFRDEDKLVWKRVFPKSGKEKITLYFLPHLSIRDEEGTKDAQCAAMLYMSAPGSEATDPSFRKWIEGLFLWTVNAYLFGRDTRYDELMNQNISGQQLKNIQGLLIEDGISQSPIDYEQDIVPFLNEYFEFQVCPPEADDCKEDPERETQSFVFFPMLPDFKLTLEKTKNDGTIESAKWDYDTTNLRLKQNIQEIKHHIHKSMADQRTDSQRKYDESLLKPSTHVSAGSKTMCVYWMQDTVTLVIKSIINFAVKIIGNRTERIEEFIKELLEVKSDDGKTLISNLAAMKSRFALFGLRVTEGGIQKSIYSDIGQLFAIQPDEISKLKFTLQKGNKLTVKMNTCTEPPGDDDKLEVTFPDCELQRMRDLLDVAVPSPDQEWPCIRPLQPYAEVPQSFPAKLGANWSINSGPSKGLHVFSTALGRRLMNGLPLLKLCRRDQSESKEIQRSGYDLATFVEVKLVKTQYDNLYELRGATGYGQKLLERLAQKLPTDDFQPDEVYLQSVHILHRDSQTNDWVSSDEPVMIFRNNLTTFSEPKDSEGLVPTISNELDIFASSLYKSGTVNSGGFFLKYTYSDWSHYQNGDAFEAQLLLSYGSQAALAPYMNAVVISEPVSGNSKSYFFLDELIYKKVPVLQPGHVGLEVFRPHPAPAPVGSPDPTAYLRRMFHLICTKVEGNGVFDDQDAADVPIAPVSVVNKLPYPMNSNQNEPKEWLQYRSVLRIENKPPVTGPVVDCQEPAYNPYSHIGENLRLRLTPRDGFGNVLDSWSTHYEMPILYRDFVVPVHQWPGTTMTYRLEKSMSLNVTLHFDPRELADPEVAQDIYATAYHHLSRSDVQAYLSSSIGNHQASVTEDLKQYALDCWCSLMTSTSPNPITTELSATIDVNWDIKEPVFEFTVDLSIKRTDEKLIDPELISISEAISGSSRIAHESVSQLTDEPNQPGTYVQDKQTLKQLADMIEENQKYKLARGAWIEGEDTNRLWIVGIGEQGNIKIELQTDTYLYAAAPLETVKHKRSFLVQNYESFAEPGESVSDPTLFAEQEADLDQWTLETFEFIDEMLRPPYLQVIGEIDQGLTLESILKCKEKIANSFTSNVNHLGKLSKEANSSQDDLPSARKRYLDAMLVQLSASYDQDTIIQQPVRVELESGDPEQMKSIGFYGSIAANVTGIEENPEQPSNTKVQASFSKAKLPLSEGINLLSYLFNVKDAGGYSKYTAEGITYKVSHIEHVATDEKRFKSSAWIKLVNPYELKLGDRMIPVVLKGHPVPPELTRHEWSAPENSSNLEEVRKWAYTFAYKLGHDAPAQDEMKYEIEWNEEGSPVLFTGDDNLPQALAQLRHIMKDIRTHMLLDTGKEKAAAYLLNAIQVISDSWLPRSMRLPKTKTSRLTTTFHTWSRIDQAEAEDGSSTLELVLDSVTGPIPASDIQIRLAGYQSETVSKTNDRSIFRFFIEETLNDATVKRYLTNKEKLHLADIEQTVTITGIDILSFRSARASLYKTRNELLLKGSSTYQEATAQAFVYRTPKVMPADPVAPVIKSNVGIDISALKSNASTQTVEAHIQTLLQELFKPGSNEIYPCTLVCSAVYRYPYLWVQPSHPIMDEGDEAEVSIPICLKHPFLYTDDDVSVKAFCNELLYCMRREDGPIREKGRFVINLKVYPHPPEVTNTKSVLSLGRLELPLNKIE